MNVMKRKILETNTTLCNSYFRCQLKLCQLWVTGPLETPLRNLNNEDEVPYIDEYLKKYLKFEKLPFTVTPRCGYSLIATFNSTIFQISIIIAPNQVSIKLQALTETEPVNESFSRENFLRQLRSSFTRDFHNFMQKFLTILSLQFKKSLTGNCQKFGKYDHRRGFVEYNF